METQSIFTSLTYILFFLLFPCITFADDLSNYTPKTPKCPSFQCGTLGTISYPFTNTSSIECGYFIDCQKEPPQINLGGRPYDVKNYFYDNRTIVLHDPFLQTQLDSKTCNLNYSLPVQLKPITQSLTLYRCSSYPPSYTHYVYKNKNCNENYNLLLYSYPSQLPPTLNKVEFPFCSVIYLPLIETPPTGNVSEVNPFALMTAELSFEWNGFCYNCYINGGQCKLNTASGLYECYKKIYSPQVFTAKKYKIGAGAGGVSLATVIILVICCIKMANSDEPKDDEASMVAKT